MGLTITPSHPSLDGVTKDMIDGMGSEELLDLYNRVAKEGQEYELRLTLISFLKQYRGGKIKVASEVVT